MKKVLLYGLLLAAMSVQAQETISYPTDTIDGKVYYRYTVEKSIGLYRISKNFGVSQEAILQANPELETRGLRFEETILIPTNLTVAPHVAQEPEPAATVQAPVAEETPAASETLENPAALEALEALEVLESPESPETADSSAIAYTDTLRLAYMLPLDAGIGQRNPMIDRFYDFYAGALLALKHQQPLWTDSLGMKHTTYYDIHTYDVGKYGSAVTQLIDSGALAQIDAFVGPAYLKPVEVLAAYALEQKKPVLVPFLQQVTNFAQNPYLLKFNPSDQVEAHALMEYLDTLRTATNIVLVDAYNDKMDYSLGIRILRDSILARDLPVTRTTIRQILADSVGTALKDSVENILLFHSERYSNVQLLMPYLLSGRQGKRLTILSQYAWQGERILLPQLFTGVFRTPEGEAYAQYEQDFAHYFGHSLSSTQPRYDLLGYDLTQYIIQAMRGGAFHASDAVYEGIQSSILFKQTGDGGYENTHIIIQKR